MPPKRRLKKKYIDDSSKGQSELSLTSLNKETAMEQADPNPSNCGMCKFEVKEIDNALQCNVCTEWVHSGCHGMSPNLYALLVEEDDPSITFTCITCLTKPRPAMEKEVDKETNTETKTPVQASSDPYQKKDTNKMHHNTTAEDLHTQIAALTDKLAEVVINNDRFQKDIFKRLEIMTKTGNDDMSQSCHHPRRPDVRSSSCLDTTAEFLASDSKEVGSAVDTGALSDGSELCVNSGSSTREDSNRNQDTSNHSNRSWSSVVKETRNETEPLFLPIKGARQRVKAQKDTPQSKTKEDTYSQRGKIRFFATRLDPQTSEAQLSYQIDQDLGIEAKVFRLRTKYPTYSSFCISIDRIHKEAFLNTCLWPEEMILQEYRVDPLLTAR